MIFARFYFDPDKADQFAWHAGQEVVEMQYDNVFDLIMECHQLEDALRDCTVLMDGQVFNLKALSV